MKMRKGLEGRQAGKPEMVLVGGGKVLWYRVLELVSRTKGTHRVRLEGCCCDPISQKGDLQHCDMGVVSDVVGKVFARVIQERLQVVAEKVLPGLQCGFRKERGCCDMIFVACQLLEKAREHQDSLFTLFVDLRKAYNSVHREALWQVLERCGVPPRMLKVVSHSM